MSWKWKQRMPFSCEFARNSWEKIKGAFFFSPFQKTLEVLIDLTMNFFSVYSKTFLFQRKHLNHQSGKESPFMFLLFVFNNIWYLKGKKAKIKAMVIIWERYPVILIHTQNGNEVFLIYFFIYITEWRTYDNI